MVTHISQSTPLEDVWNGFARTVHGESDATVAPPSIDPESLAAAIRQSELTSDRGGRILDALAQVLAALNRANGAEADTARDRISRLMAELQPDTIARLLETSGNVTAPRALMLDVAELCPLDTVLRGLFGSARATGNELSPTLVRILYKLAVQARGGSGELRGRAERAFRSQACELVGRWWLVQSDAVSQTMDGVVQPVNRADADEDAVEPEPSRLIQMSLEADAVGMAVWGPITRMLRDGRFDELLELLKHVPRGSQAARAIARQVATPQRLDLVLQRVPIDFDAVDWLIEPMGTDAADPLLDALARAESRSVRRGLFDRLASFGDSLGPLLAERLDDDRWFVQRNLLALAAELDRWPATLDPQDSLQHRDARVRREALKTLVGFAEHRDEALCTALRDGSDPATLRIALGAARERCPSAAIPILIQRIEEEEELETDLRVGAIQALHGSRSSLALDAMLRLVAGKTSMFGKKKLAPKCPEMLAALRGLAVAWPNERRAAAHLERARNSKDSEIREAANAAPAGRRTTR